MRPGQRLLKAASRVKVRCLGPGKNGEEHYFLSANPAGHRICASCALKIQALCSGVKRAANTGERVFRIDRVYDSG